MRARCQALRYPLLALLLATLGACGFQLRGTGQARVDVESAHVDAARGVRLARTVEDSLRSAGVELAAEPDAAAYVLRLTDEQRNRRAASVTGQARVAEYEMSIGVRLAIHRGQETVLPATSLLVERVYRIDRENLTGSSEEQALLVEEMERDLAQQVLRALTAAARGGG